MLRCAGRNCNQEERDAFEAYDKIHGVRAAMVEAMRKEFADLDLTFSIGGQISIDIFPRVRVIVCCGRGLGVVDDWCCDGSRAGTRRTVCVT